MPQVKLGDVVVESRETYKGDKTGMPIVGLEHLTPGEVTLSNWDTDTDNTFTKRFRKGDMLFGRRRAYLKKAAQAPFDGICSGDITVIRANEEYLLSELLPFIIQNDNLFDFAVGKSAGSLSPRVKWENLKNYTFELPPMEEQRKLAEVLWSINDTLQAYQKLLIETDALVQAQFIEMFGDPRLNPQKFPQENLEKISTVGSSKRVFVKELKTSGIPFYRGTEIGALAVGEEVTPELFITHDHYEVLKNATGVPEIGDLLMPSICPDGRIWLVDSAQPFYFKDGRVLWIHPNRDRLNSTYLQYLLKNIFRSDYGRIATGTTFAELKIVSLKKLMIMIPDLKLQEKFSAIVHQINLSKFALQSTIASLQATKRCILENALGTGRKE